MAKDATLVNIGAKDISAIVDFAKNNDINYAVVAPDDPLVLGCVDALNEIGIDCLVLTRQRLLLKAVRFFLKIL
jgi:phosphoribosylamine--glycine ligase